MNLVRLLVAKDLRVLGRSRFLLVALIVYPLLLAVLLAVVARDAGSRPRIAYVDDAHLPKVVVIGSTRIDYDRLLGAVRARADLVPMSLAAARAALDGGSVVAIVRVPAGFVDDLRSTLTAPELDVAVRGGAVGERALREVQAFVYGLNAAIQRELLAEALGFLRIVVTGGTAELAGANLKILGLEQSARTVDDVLRAVSDPTARARLADVRDFANAARAALGLAEPSLRVVAQPVALATRRVGDDDLLGTRGIGVVIALGAVLAAMLLGAAAMASEREELTLARLVRGRVPLTSVLVAKVVQAALVALAIGLAVVVLHGLVARAAGAPAPAVERLPAVLPVLLGAGTAAGAIGVLVAVIVRDLATSALVALLLALPFVLAGVIGRAGGGVVRAISDVFPFAPATDGLVGVLYDPSAGAALGRAVAVLAGITIASFLVAHLLGRRLI